MNSATCENSQVAKFRNRAKFRNSAKFRNLRNFAMLNFLLFSAPLSFWFLICNAEFDLNSLCLDQLNNFGINSLQKL